MLRMQIYLPEKLIFGLKTRSIVENVSMSEVIRRCLEEKLSVGKRVDPMKEFVGKLHTKKKTNSVKLISDYYKGNLK
ncbi:hypothetical protein CO010_01020 [Candidatus Shapirobacteria bacterium CG_4_8_14_3_um_filter_39_11]|uniref:Ribbon-helix-helix protein CopG domain-containing protein n=2 Tax=Candidatus Shapironibacteriota TaxID=1752721 RepID=A0A2M8EU67_9BACT|nr:MAG: hypothetical protein CO053_03425 [Candidatus Shapirobacteria bacterium CG_4_9_14_0_2_um_filter_40_11]PJC77060.1 MAG: hypothetical protein CO010_01020 [Candidatus Shapirobacteria bacterium CG_4_8_14_3_um_filter_39_11]